ncbi:hypothetical protein BDN70DRAFT_878165 [Pholiota conissans]|uniref:Uncharacterized protein n=1 Tax=Pholiota conissans TaxID=109636 RepID=A0A9P6CUV1_9AGAR|nr:hypothetical protein BDN70DRAFT_878165 [Pholiota conissans]
MNWSTDYTEMACSFYKQATWPSGVPLADNACPAELGHQGTSSTSSSYSSSYSSSGSVLQPFNYVERYAATAPSSSKKRKAEDDDGDAVMASRKIIWTRDVQKQYTELNEIDFDDDDDDDLGYCDDLEDYWLWDDVSEDVALRLPGFVELEKAFASIREDNPEYLGLSNHEKRHRIADVYLHARSFLTQLKQDAQHCPLSDKLMMMLRQHDYHVGAGGLGVMVDDIRAFETHMRTVPGATRKNWPLATHDASEVGRRRRVIAKKYGWKF